MKNYTLLLLLCLLSIASYSQKKVPSSCIASDSVRALYRTDAQRIALSRIYKYNSPYKDSLMIPEIWTDTIMRALLAVHNTSSILPAADSVMTLDIHSKEYQDTNSFFLNLFKVQADYSAQWVKDIENNIYPTSDTNINRLMAKYTMKPSYMFHQGSIAVMYFECDSNFNLDAVGKEWVLEPTVYTAGDPGYTIGSGNSLQADTLTDSFVILTYSLGWNDCPAGCTCIRWWKFKVYLSDCAVEFLNSGGSSSPNCILPYPNSIEEVYSELTTVYPNPFNGYIQISKPQAYLSYRLFDMTGRLIKQGQPDKTGKIYTAELLTGLYTLLLQTDTQSYSIRIVKE